jgi:hypothetical protein
MNLMKSAFISTYMTVVMIVAGYGGRAIYKGGDPLAWGGVMLTVAPILMVIGFLMLFKTVARTSAHFPVINLLGAIGTALSLLGWRNGATVVAPALAVASWVGFLLY